MQREGLGNTFTIGANFWMGPKPMYPERSTLSTTCPFDMVVFAK
jgi:hypothetical protein